MLSKTLQLACHKAVTNHLAARNPAFCATVWRRYSSNASSSASDDSTSNLTSDLVITERCARRLCQLTEDAKKEVLRVRVDSGGCSGFEYKFSLDPRDNIDPKEDVLFEKDGATVVVDNMSLQFIRGATVDFTEELIRSSFKILDNPVAEQGCSCGTSFAVRLD